MREVLAARRPGDAAATLALDVYVHRLRASIAAMAASLGGLDALVFTGGVGERSAPVRALAAEGLGVPRRRAGSRHQRGPPTRTARSAARRAGVRTFVIAAREDLEIARQVRAVFG